MPEQWERGGYVVSTDRSRLDIDVVLGFLRGAYWAGEHLPREVVERAVEHSLCFGLYGEGWQVGFARAVTDYATFAYIADVFVLEEHRGRGLGVWLMECVSAHPGLQGLRRWMLGTRDAHALYEKTGFTRVKADDDRWMEKADPEVYARMAKGTAS
ncbi:MAG: GNAT family N-acetyltransferase [Dehalococcoidia bacterium]